MKYEFELWEGNNCIAEFFCDRKKDAKDWIKDVPSDYEVEGITDAARKLLKEVGYHVE